MKKIILLFLSFITYVFVTAQQGRISGDSIANLLRGKVGCGMLSQPKEKEYKLSLSSYVHTYNDSPFYIVDGVSALEAEVKKINPDNIASIEIINEASNIISCIKFRPGIIITTNNADHRTIWITDLETRESLPGATVELISGESSKDTIRIIADANGKVSTNKIRAGILYELRVSCIGYKNFAAMVDRKHLKDTYDVALQKVNSVLTEVFIVSHGPRTIRCCVSINCYQTKKIIKTKIDSREPNLLVRIYPNPVRRSQNINVELKPDYPGRFTIKLFGLDGKLVSSSEFSPAIGINRLSYPINSFIAAGVYSIQLIDQDGRLLKTEKLIIQ